MSWQEFTSLNVETSRGTLFARVGGQGDPLVLLHGFPQTHLMWERVASELCATHRVVCFDLPGYGASDPPENIEAASKRTMAQQVVEAMESLGYSQFAVAGHDRGGRVAYRMAFDHPNVVVKLAVLDILPTLEYWQKMNHAFAMKIYHWAFLAQPEPLPEKLIGAAPEYYIDHTLQSWTAKKDLSCFDDHALNVYRQQAGKPRNLKAMCDDYRAGESLDVDHDKADYGNRKIACRTLVLWGSAGIASNAATPLDTWRQWCIDVEGEAIESGHFIPEENPDATAFALERFFH